MPEPLNQKNAIAFIDTSVGDYQTLLKGIAPGTEIHLLDPHRDGIEQISEVLANRRNISSLHIISHGNYGELQVGQMQLSAENIATYAARLQQWRDSLSEDADLLLYGCNIGTDATFLQQIHQLSGADIAASDNLTGSSLRGADWELEAQIGAIENPILIDQAAQEQYQSVLATINVTTGVDEDDSLLGGGSGVSLREAILYSNPGDTISLPAGTYTLTRFGVGEDTGETGDLDITKNLTITGAGPATTTINTTGSWDDRVIHIDTAITVDISGVTITGGQPINDSGGGILNTNGTVNISNSNISGNNPSSTGQGGGIFNSAGTINITNSAINNNFVIGGNGAGIYNNGILTITGSTVYNNASSGLNGGGIYNTNTVNITNSNINTNTAIDGGGIYNAAGVSVTLTNSSVIGNAANNGAGIFSDFSGSLTINSSTISGNNASQNGGGITTSSNNGTITNSTISGNTANNFGGIRNGGVLSILNSTITQNSATNQNGGIYNTNSASIKNTIIAQNTAGFNPDIDSNFSSQGNNLIGDGTGGTGFTNGVNGDQVGTAATPINAQLGPLQNNGGVTQTHALLAGSPAIDNGSNAGAPATDQRGQARPQDGDRDTAAITDIGAFEFPFSNTNPVAVADNAATTPATPVNIQVLANDTDADGDYLKVQNIGVAPTNGTVVIEDDVYAGGVFATAGGVPANRIAKWDGSTWSALGSGMDNYVQELTTKGGNLYASGAFTIAGGISANRIAQWNGSSWLALGTGVNSIVDSIATEGNNLYAGGYFTTAGGLSANRIAKWNGSSWSALGSGMDSTVFAVTRQGDNVYAGGPFTTAGGISASGIAQWNGSNWSALGTGMNNAVFALTTQGTNLYAGGAFTTAGGIGANYIAQWNGSSWSALGTGMNSTVYALTSQDTNLYAGGGFTIAGGISANSIAQWNGSSWSALGTGLNNLVDAIAVSGNNVYAGGQFTTAGGIPANRIAKWDGTTWSPLGSGLDGEVLAIAIDPGRSIIYTPNPGFNGVDTFTYTITDNLGGTSSASASVLVNNSPILDNSGTITLTPINANDSNNPGTLISEILATNPITDADAGASQGIAIANTDTTNGTWQYTINNGTNWQNFPPVSGNNALLLANDPNTRIRFIPNPNFVGTVPNSITFHGWDQITGTNGGTADVANDLIANGSSSSFSLATETADIVVNPTISINDITVNETTATADFTVSLLAASNQTITVDYATADNTATAGSDYTAIPPTPLTFNPGETSKIVSIPLTDDNIIESNESFFVNLSNATNSAIADPQGIATITDNDIANIIIFPNTGLTTTEAGATTSFDISLTSQPSDNVTINLVSSDPAEGTVIPAITFTPANWLTHQTVVVTGVDDNLVDGDINYTIQTSVTSSDPNYNVIDPIDPAITNTDNDSANIIITPNTGLTTTEGGTPDSYTVVLTSQPSADVTITLTPDTQSDLGLGSGTPINLTFTAANWNTLQTVTVTATDDNLAEGNHSSTITHSVSSSDPNYNGIAIAPITLNITDNDSAGVSITQSGGTTETTEGGAADTYDIVLTTQPTAPVTIRFTSNTQINPIPDILFDNNNWNIPQTITITAVDDPAIEGNHTATITHSAISTDPNYNNIAINSISANIIDNDSAGVTITQSAGSTDITEGGNPDSYTVVLTSQPTANLTVTITPDGQTDLGTGAGNATSLIFTPTNWNQIQTLNIAAVDDAVAEGNHISTITHSVTSNDSNYNNLSINSITANITDNDSAGISIIESGSSTDITEGGATDTYDIVLTTAPTTPVTIRFNSSSQINPISDIIFDSSNWNIPQSVTVTAADDTAAEGNHSATITHSVISTDPNYNNFSVAAVNTNITDNDSAGISIFEPGGTTDITEGGTTDSYDIVLTTQPTSNVTINISSDAQSSVTPALTFTPQNWNIPQSVAVSAIDDTLAEGNHNSTITHSVVSSDSNYNNMTVNSITANVTDNDSAGISIIPSGGSTDITEGGATDSYNIVLTTAPTAPVTIQFTTGSQINPIADITFDNTNWNIAQTVTVVAADDTLSEGNHNATISHTAVSTDSNYNGIAIAPLNVNLTDNDIAAVSITPQTTAITEAGGTSSYNIVITTVPTAPVTIRFNTGNQINPIADITFNSSNWNTPQTVTVVAVDDTLAEGNHNATISHTAVSTDPNYNGIAIAPLTFNIADNDTANLIITESGESTNITEGGATDTYTMVLSTAPTAPVTVRFNTGNQINPIPDIIFDNANWNIAQTVTLSATDDTLAEGNHTANITHTIVSSDSNYNNLAVAAVTANITDNDSAGISIVESNGTTDVTEGGATDSYNIVLTTQPTANVTINITSDSQTSVTTPLTFTPQNWNVAQTVTVTAINDNLVEGNHPSTITHTATSSDNNYNGIAINSINANVTDNDSAGVSLNLVDGEISEAGKTTTYQIVLTTAPSSAVTIQFTTDNQINPVANITFDSSNWNIAQTVTVSAVNDTLAEGNHNATITHTAISNDTNYNGIAIAPLTFNIADNDIPAVSITPQTTDITEAGATGSYNIVLTTAPTAPVTIQFNTGNQINPIANITFDSNNWNIAQTVTVSAVNDTLAEGNHNATISHTAISTDPNYNNIAIAPLTFNIADNDTPGVTLTQTNGSTTLTEGATGDTYDIVLTSAPSTPVTINITTDNQINSVAPITFNATNWNTPQTITLTAVDDTLAEGLHTSNLQHTIAAGSATEYLGVAIASISATITDNDTPNVIIQSNNNLLTEGGTTNTATVRLTTAPTAPVTVNFTTGNQINSVTPVTFDATNWNTPQTITVTAINDNIAEGLHPGTVTAAIAPGSASEYIPVQISPINYQITDNDTPAIAITVSGGSLNLTEGGTTDFYDIVLTSAPVAPVTISFFSSNQITGIPPITFDSSNWNLAQRITVTATEDLLVEGNHTATITHSASSTDPNYNNIPIVSVSANITDNDSAGISIIETAGSSAVVEGGTTDSYDVVLTKQPTADVTVTFNTDNQVTATSPLIFTTTNWNVPQTVTVSAIDDTTIEGNHNSTITTAVTSSDSNYNNLEVQPIVIAISDNDSVAPPTPLPMQFIQPLGSTEVLEGFGRDYYKVVLTQAPTADVAIALTTDGQTTTDVTRLVFTPQNWNVPQTVTVTGVDDTNAEGTAASSVLHTVTSADLAFHNRSAIANIVVIDNDNTGIVRAIAGAGNLAGTDLDDTFTGSPEREIVHTRAGNDSYVDSLGDDIVYGGEGSDYIAAGAGNDQVYGNVDNDYLNGNQDNDLIFAGAGRDRVHGGEGSDRIFGDDGDDHLWGDRGSDTISGGTGKDVFAIGNGTGGFTLPEADTITDFEINQDRIDLLAGLMFNQLKIYQGTGINSADTIVQIIATGEFLAVLQQVNANSLKVDSFV